MMNIKAIYTCKRCNHEWAPRTERRPIQCPSCHSAFWSQAARRTRTNPEPGELEDVARLLNDLVRQKKLKGWAIYGSVAYSLQTEPLTTRDVDILIPADTNQEYTDQFHILSEIGDGFSGLGILIQGVLVEIFLTLLNPMFEEAITNAKRVRIGGTIFRLFRPEYLVVMALLAWRADSSRGVDDRQRARRLLQLRGVQERTRELLAQYGDVFPNITKEELRERFYRAGGEGAEVSR